MADTSPNAAATAASDLPPSNTASHARIRRRNRIIASCLECRRRKLKCDKTQPGCTNCTKFRRDCRYIGSTLDHATQQRLSDFKDQMGSLEQVLERDVAKTKAKRVTVRNESSDEDEEASGLEDESDLEPSQLTVLDQVYDDDADDDLMDLGVQVGKMRVSERIGGFVRPKFADELDSTLMHKERPDVPPKPSMAGFDLPQGDPELAAWMLQPQQTYIDPGPDYIAPASNFFMSSDTRQSLMMLLPPRGTCDKLFDRYWTHCHPVVSIVHKPSFKLQYGFFWQNYMVGQEPPASTQAVIVASLFISAVSLPETGIFDRGWTRTTLLSRLQPAVESALARANFLRTTKLETMQAFVIYLLALCRSEISRSHSALTGAAIRLAECMGLHRDGTNYGFSALETHVRRLVWYQLCFLDIRTAESVGPRPQIHREDFDTKLPLNVNEDDFLMDPPPTEDYPYFTDMTLSRIRFETTEMHRMVWVEQPRLEAKKIKPGIVLSRVSKWQADMETRSLPLLAGSDQRQLLAQYIYRILSSRLYTMILHRYIVGAPGPVPERLRRILIDSVLTTNEFTISLDTRFELSNWAWYRGAFLQYHSALILLFEANRDPASADIPRIWKVLDYVFELPAGMSNRQKADDILFHLRERLGVWSAVRKARVPKRTEEALAVLRGSGMGKTHPEVLDMWQTSMDMQYTTNMDPSRFGLPPLYSMYSMSDSSSQPAVTGAENSPQSTGPGGTQNINGQMGAMEDLWADWDKPQPTSPIEGASLVAIPDLNLGSWTPFVASGRDPWERRRT